MKQVFGECVAPPLTLWRASSFPPRAQIAPSFSRINRDRVSFALIVFSVYHSTIPSVDESLIQSMFGLYGIGWVGDFCVVLLVFLWFATHIVDFLIKLHLSLERYSDFHIFTSKMPRLYFELLHESVHLISRERLVISRERGVCCYADVRHIFQ